MNVIKWNSWNCTVVVPTPPPFPAPLPNFHALSQHVGSMPSTPPLFESYASIFHRRPLRPSLSSHLWPGNVTETESLSSRRAGASDMSSVVDADDAVESSEQLPGNTEISGSATTHCQVVTRPKIQKETWLWTMDLTPTDRKQIALQSHMSHDDG